MRIETFFAIVREWLEGRTLAAVRAKEVDALTKQLLHVRAGRAFTRDEMNERSGGLRVEDLFT